MAGPGGAFRRPLSMPWYIFSMHPFPSDDRILKQIKDLRIICNEYFCYAANMNTRTGAVAGALPRLR